MQPLHILQQLHERRFTMDTTPKLYAALIKAKQDFGSLKVNADNPYFNSKYLDLAGVQDATDAALHKNGLVVIQTTDITETGHPVLVTTLAHESGEAIAGRYPLTPKETNNPQSLGGCVTYARRYALMGMLGIAPEDDDGNASSGKPTTATATRPVQSGAATGQTVAKNAGPGQGYTPVDTGGCEYPGCGRPIDQKWIDIAHNKHEPALCFEHKDQKDTTRWPREREDVGMGSRSTVDELADIDQAAEIFGDLPPYQDSDR